MWRINLKLGAVTIVVVLLYTGIAHVIPQLESDVPEDLDLGPDATPDALVAAGESVFNGAGGCTACHGLGTRAPNLRSDHAGLGNIGGRCVAGLSQDCKEYLYASLTTPGDSVVSGFENIMSDMRRQLPEDQIWAAVAYLQSLGGEVTVTGADLVAADAPVQTASASRPATTEPRAVLQASACLGCHQLDGAGPQLGPAFDGMGGRLTAEEIRQAILDPRATVAEGYEQFAGVMPATFGEQLSAAQLEAVVQFLAERR